MGDIERGRIMKNKALRTALVSLQFAIAGGCVCVLYVVYVPLALIRVLVDKDGFSGFLDCVGKCVRTITGWFRKSGSNV